MEDNRGDFVCSCLPGYTGKQCETEISVHPLCENNHCLNDGICTISTITSKIECLCPEGFTGVRCEVNILLLYYNVHRYYARN